MEQFIEKLIGRLKKYQIEYKSGFGELTDETVFRVMENVIYTIKELAEEYKQDTTFQYVLLQTDILKIMGIDVGCKWETATQQTCALNEAYLRGRQDERDKFAEWHDKGGWIPCSERLPKKRDWYLAVFQEGDSDFVLVPRVADYIGKETVCTTNEGWLIIDLEDEIGINAYYKKLKCIAWQPLPEPYKTEGE